MAKHISIAQRFHGPPNSGNGGYSCGLVASQLNGAAKVRLHVPLPLDTEMVLTTKDDGSVTLHHDETLVATGRASDLAITVPKPPSLEQAISGTTRYVGHEDHFYPSCFVCGPERQLGDGLCLYPGPINQGDWQLLACPWQPSPDLLDSDGMLKPEFIWAALDCPSYFGVAGDTGKKVLLGELEAKLMAPIPGSSQLVVFSWPIGIDGRKLYGGSAIANQQGEVLACAKGTWIELK